MGRLKASWRRLIDLRPLGPGPEVGSTPSAPGSRNLVIRTAPRARERVRAWKVGKSYLKILSLNLM